MNELLDSLVEVKIAEEEDFLKIKETLTRIGVASRKERKLYQSCHIFHKQGRYYIVHFKEMFLLDGKESSFGEEDRRRRNTIVDLLQEWGLVTIINTSLVVDKVNMTNIKVLPFKEKNDWQLICKYSIGSNK